MALFFDKRDGHKRYRHDETCDLVEHGPRQPPGFEATQPFAKIKPGSPVHAHLACHDLVFSGEVMTQGLT